MAAKNQSYHKIAPENQVTNFQEEWLAKVTCFDGSRAA